MTSWVDVKLDMGGAAELPMTRLGTDCVLSKLRWPFATPSGTRQSLPFFFISYSLGLGEDMGLTLTATTSYALQGHLHVERNAMLGCVDVCSGGK